MLIDGERWARPAREVKRGDADERLLARRLLVKAALGDGGRALQLDVADIRTERAETGDKRRAREFDAANRERGAGKLGI